MVFSCKKKNHVFAKKRLRTSQLYCPNVQVHTPFILVERNKMMYHRFKFCKAVSLHLWNNIKSFSCSCGSFCRVYRSNRMCQWGWHFISAYSWCFGELTFCSVWNSKFLDKIFCNQTFNTVNIYKISNSVIWT